MLDGNRTLTKLHLDNNDIPDECASVILGLWQCQNELTYLNLKGNWISLETQQKLESKKPAKVKLEM